MTTPTGRRGRTKIIAGLSGAALTLTSLWLSALPASAATTATFTQSAGLLSVFGDNLANTITISRNAAGRILINGGAVTVAGGVPTVTTTTQIQVFGQGGTDVITMDEANGPLPIAHLFGGAANDTLTGGSSSDQLFGQAGDDTLLGRGGFDLLFGGDDNDTLTGGDADDQMFGELGDDRLIWGPGDDTDLNEGGAGNDTVQITGGNGAESFTATTNGVRVRFDRVSPAPFSLDIGNTENLSVNANGGDDRFDGSGLTASSIKPLVDGGVGDDVLIGGPAADVFVGGDGTDSLDGHGGDDVLLAGAGDDRVAWRAGDGNDVIEGQSGRDQLRVLGTAADEGYELRANGGRLLVLRDLDTSTLDLNDFEQVVLRGAAGADRVEVRDLAGTDLTDLNTDFSRSTTRAPGAERDTIHVDGTQGADVIAVTGSAPIRRVTGLTPAISVARLSGAPAARIVIDGRGGADVMTATELVDPSGIQFDGNVGEDVLVGSPGDDQLFGGANDDVLVGGGGTDVLDGGAGDNVIINGASASRAWLADNARLLTRR